MLFERLFLLRLPTNKAMLLQKLTDNPATHRRARGADAPGNLRLTQVGPANGPLRTARRVLSDNLQKGDR
jgi:hypothetical protein